MPEPKIRMGCLHMHHSNIAYIDSIVDPDRVELLHFVDPGLMRRIGSDAAFTPAEAEQQVRRQLAWMASCGLDAILITCTNYIAMLPDEPLELAMPIVKIDEPFFADLLRQPVPHLLLFTNPATVEGTMRRFADYARLAGQEPDIEVEIIEGTFELVMAGRTEEYAAVVASRLRELAHAGAFASISVGQLSMADAARRVSSDTEHVDRQSPRFPAWPSCNETYVPRRGEQSASTGGAAGCGRLAPLLARWVGRPAGGGRGVSATSPGNLGIFEIF